VFRDRIDAGIQLGAALATTLSAPSLERCLVLGIARGGVIVGAEVARVLGVPIDIAIPRKLGAPGNPELGVGAVAPGVQVLDRGSIEALGVPASYLARETASQLEEIERRTVAYRGHRPPLDLHATTSIIVDDGVATGMTAIAALRWARARGATTTIFAAPVGPVGVEERFAEECDRCVILQTPANLRAVGQWYEMFDQTTDDQVRIALTGPTP
jgi:putative phosphoribosyl transferase